MPVKRTYPKLSLPLRTNDARLIVHALRKLAELEKDNKQFDPNVPLAMAREIDTLIVEKERTR